MPSGSPHNGDSRGRLCAPACLSGLEMYALCNMLVLLKPRNFMTHPTAQGNGSCDHTWRKETQVTPLMQGYQQPREEPSLARSGTYAQNVSKNAEFKRLAEMQVLCPNISRRTWSPRAPMAARAVGLRRLQCRGASQHVALDRTGVCSGFSNCTCVHSWGWAHTPATQRK